MSFAIAGSSSAMRMPRAGVSRGASTRVRRSDQRTDSMSAGRAIGSFASERSTSSASAGGVSPRSDPTGGASDDVCAR